MHEKDVESVIIWDQYLAYAVAFGIPVKITRKVNEKDIKTNVYIKLLSDYITE